MSNTAEEVLMDIMKATKLRGTRFKCLSHRECTGTFSPEDGVVEVTGWRYAPDEGDVPMHDCWALIDLDGATQATMVLPSRETYVITVSRNKATK